MVSMKGHTRINCVNCGKRHYILPDFVGYEDDALCTFCNKENDGGMGD